MNTNPMHRLHNETVGLARNLVSDCLGIFMEDATLGDVVVNLSAHVTNVSRLLHSSVHHPDAPAIPATEVATVANRLNEALGAITKFTTSKVANLNDSAYDHPESLGSLIETVGLAIGSVAQLGKTYS